MLTMLLSLPRRMIMKSIVLMICSLVISEVQLVNIRMCLIQKAVVLILLKLQVPKLRP